jgi:hypothetical protein
LAGIENLFAASWVNAAPEVQLVDAFQRTALYLDLLRRRGNQEEENRIAVDSHRAAFSSMRR